jgi:hypothetical protein
MPEIKGKWRKHLQIEIRNDLAFYIYIKDFLLLAKL